MQRQKLVQGGAQIVDALAGVTQEHATGGFVTLQGFVSTHHLGG